MPSIPVPSSEPTNPVTQSTFYNTIERDNTRLETLEKGGLIPTSDILVQTVTNGDTDHAPSGDAVFDFVADSIVDNLVQTVTNGDTDHAPSADAVFDYVEAKRLTAVANLNFPNVVALTSQSLNITVTGAVEGDAVALGPPSGVNAGFAWNAWVTAPDTVRVKLYNTTAVDINPPAADWRATVFK